MILNEWLKYFNIFTISLAFPFITISSSASGSVLIPIKSNSYFWLFWRFVNIKFPSTLHGIWDLNIIGKSSDECALTLIIIGVEKWFPFKLDYCF